MHAQHSQLAHLRRARFKELFAVPVVDVLVFTE